MAFDYAKEIERVKESLSKADPLSEDYSRGLATISTLRWLRGAEATGSDVECFEQTPDIKFIKDKAEPTPEPEPVKEAEFPPEEPTPFPEPVAEAKTWTKADVREKLAELKKQGKDLKELFKQFSASKLSDVKEEDYPALMAKAEEM